MKKSPQTSATKSSTVENQIPSANRTENPIRSATTEDNQPRSATTQDHQLRSATVQENPKRSADIDEHQRDKIVNGDSTMLNILNPQGFAFRQFLIDSRNARDTSVERSREMTYRSAISGLQAKINQSSKNLPNGQSTWNLYEQTVEYAQEK